jgi:protein-tyrosine phosphatase
MTEIISNLFVGTRDDAAKLAVNGRVPQGWTVISVTEYRAKYGRSEECPNEPRGALEFPFMEGGAPANPMVLDRCADMIHRCLLGGEKVLVHCVHAHERSPLAIAWFLAWRGHCPTLEEAVTYVVNKHPQTENRLRWVEGMRPRSWTKGRAR